MVILFRGCDESIDDAIGHHNNAVVMGLASYRFSQFQKAGWPVTLAVIATVAIWIW